MIASLLKLGFKVFEI